MSVEPSGLRSDQYGAYSGVDTLEAMEGAVRYNTFLAALVAEAAGSDPEVRILDFGAGTGTLARVARERGHEVECVEPDVELGRRLQAEGFGWVGSIEELRGETFGVVYTFNVLEHIQDDAAALAALLTVTEPGGRLLVYVPAFPILFTAVDRHVGHFRRYRRRELVKLVEGAGFIVDRCRFADSLGFFATLTYRISRGSGTLNERAVRAYDRLVFPLSRAVDRLVDRWFGKNLVLHAHRPS